MFLSVQKSNCWWSEEQMWNHYSIQANMAPKMASKWPPRWLPRYDNNVLLLINEWKMCSRWLSVTCVWFYRISRVLNPNLDDATLASLRVLRSFKMATKMAALKPPCRLYLVNRPITGLYMIAWETLFCISQNGAQNGRQDGRHCNKMYYLSTSKGQISVLLVKEQLLIMMI